MREIIWENMTLQKALAIDFLLSISKKKEMQEKLEKYLNTDEAKTLFKITGENTMTEQEIMEQTIRYSADLIKRLINFECTGKAEDSDEVDQYEIPVVCYGYQGG